MAHRLARCLGAVLGISLLGACASIGSHPGAGTNAGETERAADLIVTGGRVYVGSTGAFEEALAIRGARIVRVGSRTDVEGLRGPLTVVLDARGGSVVPGFNDAHVHLLGAGLSLGNVQLDDGPFDRIASRIRAFAAAHPERPWIVGSGWYYDSFPGKMPTRQQLDALVPDRPAYLTADDGHTAWVNTRALQLAGITKDTPDPRNGIIVRDPVTGEPTGVLEETAKLAVARLLPVASRSERLDAIREAIREAQRVGVTSVQTTNGTAEEVALYDELRGSGDLGVRVLVSLWTTPDVSESDADRLDALRTAHRDDPIVRVSAVKIMLDGVVEAHTAAMLAPYADRDTSGTPRYTAAELDRAVTLLDGRGWQVWTHAIGDRAVRMALDAYANAARANALPARDRRHRIEHVETLDPQDIPRFAALGVIASQQPIHSNPAPSQLPAWAEKIGPERATRGWAYATLLRSGAYLAFGTDWPVTPLDPRLGLHVATTRTAPDGYPEGGWLPGERLTLGQAIDAYTTGSAYASFDEQQKGRLAPGMLADVVVLTTDVFAPGAKVLDTSVAFTIFNGKVVFQR